MKEFHAFWTTSCRPRGRHCWGCRGNQGEKFRHGDDSPTEQHHQTPRFQGQLTWFRLQHKPRAFPSVKESQTSPARFPRPSPFVKRPVFLAWYLHRRRRHSTARRRRDISGPFARFTGDYLTSALWNDEKRGTVAASAKRLSLHSALPDLSRRSGKSFSADDIFGTKSNDMEKVVVWRRGHG